jgi:quinol monooxygenase YgiN
MLLIIGRFRIKAGQAEAFRAFAKEVVENQKHVAGCLSFELLQDMAQDDTYMMLESWQDRPSLNRHFDTEEYISADAKLNEMLVEEADWQEYEI